jgi:predicted AlkP superfamily pyrophosphatase or phosphodiesterase
MPNLFRLAENNGFVKEIKINHLPTSTPSGHATISTGLLPKDHKILGSEWFNNDGYLENLMKKDEKVYTIDECITDFNSRNSIITFAKKFQDIGYNVYCLSGKRDVSAILGSGLGINNICDCDDNNKLLTDEGIINRLKGKLLEFNESSNNLIIVSLSENDYKGHRFGPRSEEVKNHLTYLDNKLSGILTDRKLKDTIKIITSDHGAVETAYVARIEELNDKSVFRLFNSNNGLEIKSSRIFLEKEIKTISDGICYVFTKDKSLNYKTKNYLQEMLSNYVNIEDVNTSKLDFIINSKNELLGDYVLIPRLIASKNFRFVKESWGTEIKGEHGSISSEETRIPLIVLSKIELLRLVKQQSEILKNLFEIVRQV